jgi:hypothetical protein
MTKYFFLSTLTQTVMCNFTRSTISVLEQHNFMLRQLIPSHKNLWCSKKAICLPQPQRKLPRLAGKPQCTLLEVDMHKETVSSLSTNIFNFTSMCLLVNAIYNRDHIKCKVYISTPNYHTWFKNRNNNTNFWNNLMWASMNKTQDCIQLSPNK